MCSSPPGNDIISDLRSTLSSNIGSNGFSSTALVAAAMPAAAGVMAAAVGSGKPVKTQHVYVLARGVPNFGVSVWFLGGPLGFKAS